MEYLVNISKRRSILELKRRHFEEYYSDNQYTISIKEDTAYPCLLHSPKWSLNEDILKITILKTNTPYPSRKIRRIRACTHQRPQRKEDQYATAAPYFLSRLLLLTSCAECCSLLLEQTVAPYFLSRLLLLLMKRHCSLPHEETLLSSLEDITSPPKETLFLTS
ncbi:hypothetical protein Tco_1490556 [Tanacetum coccineum]